MGQPDLAAVRQQLEFYFSDSNLPRDKFLLSKTEENEGGYVDISLLNSFKRMKCLNLSLEHIVSAVQQSKLLALDDSKCKIRRVTPLPSTSLFSSRSVFVKGWVPGSEEPSLEEVMKLFAPYGNVLAVRIRRWNDDEGTHFKGSAFVEMESAEAVERVVAEKYPIKVKDKDGKEIQNDLQVIAVDEYFEEKSKIRQARVEKYKAKRAEFAKKKKGEQGDVVKNEEKKEEEIDEQKAENGGGLLKNENVWKDKIVESAKDDEAKQKEEEKKEKDVKNVMTRGLVIQFSGMADGTSREDIREAFEGYGEIDYINFHRGAVEGHVRFKDVESVRNVLKNGAEADIKVGGQKCEFSLLEGDAEVAYWEEVWESKERRKSNDRGKKRGREFSRGGRGGRGGKRFKGGGRGRGGGYGRR